MTLGAYRYELTRWWGPGEDDDPGHGTVSRKRILWVMLNPSTADEHQDDPTIRRCMGFSRDWGFPGLTVVNLFAYRATKPAELFDAKFPTGAANDYAISAHAHYAPMIVCAWGTAAARRLDRAHMVADFLHRHYADRLRVLGLTMEGWPRHPLYVAADTVPIPWSRGGTV